MTPLPYVETTRVGVTRIDWIFERSIARYASCSFFVEDTFHLMNRFIRHAIDGPP